MPQPGGPRIAVFPGAMVSFWIVRTREIAHDGVARFHEKAVRDPAPAWCVGEEVVRSECRGVSGEEGLELRLQFTRIAAHDDGNVMPFSTKSIPIIENSNTGKCLHQRTQPRPNGGP